jgi:cell division protein FtsB
MNRAFAFLGRGVRVVALAGVVTIAFALLLMFLGVIPLRSYQTQRHDLASNRQRLTMLKDRNARLEERTRLLQTDTEIERVARQQFGMVKPGQTLVLTPGLRDIATSPSTLDDAVGPAPSDVERKTPSRGRAILETLLFWR